ncbi:hypothetical protein Ade02nite_17210 [Paractinoplanes deccanensis]|uniref:Uncharacterized protein n=1 Tax=Paractinoplanes deccanensis TaxID=113561 RepID=A0ABQ3XZN7_9ACTN|nr:hypothetical protein [Actinoplanes deccanensis]GID73080.1 hypothetical protein Ade02nite_17210 [Actinoplanes deccanensis]
MRNTRNRVAVLVAGVLLLVLAVVVSRPERETAAFAAAVVPVRPPSPYELAVASLREQSAALMRGDEAAWLAAVSPGLRQRYRSMFRSLRALEVSRFDYAPGVARPVKGDRAAVEFRAEVSYCFGAEMCPGGRGPHWQQPPRIEQRLTFKPHGERYVISAVAAGPEGPRRPAPWESGDLAVLRGSRVTLLAAPSERRHLARLLPIAEAAARADDRFAALMGTPQARYRIYLAGEAQWRSWYGGEASDWAIGLAVPLNMWAIDVVLRMSEFEDDPRFLRVALQHELGHVVTLSGAYRADAAEDTWLSEGIAEYIGWSPRGAEASLRRDSVRWQLRTDPPRSMVPARPGPDAPSRAGDAFYGLSHFAVDCMAQRYGEGRLFTFVRLVLVQDNEYDQAARDAYGVPFSTVDETCASWTRSRVLSKDHAG